MEITDHVLKGIVDDDIREIAIRHHEKLDGSGYFRGLKGDELTRPQRIVAVADIISALYGKRSYKEAFAPDKIKAIIQADADNNKICPAVVDVAVKNMESIIRNFEKKKEAVLGTYMQIKNRKMIYMSSLKACKTWKHGEDAGATMVPPESSPCFL